MALANCSVLCMCLILHALPIAFLVDHFVLFLIVDTYRLHWNAEFRACNCPLNFIILIYIISGHFCVLGHLSQCPSGIYSCNNKNKKNLCADCIYSGCGVLPTSFMWESVCGNSLALLVLGFCMCTQLSAHVCPMHATCTSMS